MVIFTSERKPLPNRFHFILSRQECSVQNEEKKTKKERSVFWFSNFPSALEFASQSSTLMDQIFVIGGSEVFQEAMASPFCKSIYLTKILKEISFRHDLSFFG